MREGKWGLKAGDYALFACVALVVVFLLLRVLGEAPGGREAIVTSGREMSAFRLDADRRVAIEGPLGTTIVVIEGGEVWIEDSPCREKTCVRMGKKSRAGEQIVCLPNRVVVEVVGEDVEFDAVSR